MAWPNKLRGWRNINIDGRPFKWRFDGTLDVLASPQGQRLRVHWPPAAAGWVLDTAPSEPFIIKPSFVREAALSAINAGWSPDASGGIFSVEYLHPVFQVAREDPSQTLNRGT